MLGYHTSISQAKVQSEYIHKKDPPSYTILQVLAFLPNQCRPKASQGLADSQVGNNLLSSLICVETYLHYNSNSPLFFQERHLYQLGSNSNRLGSGVYHSQILLPYDLNSFAHRDFI